MEQERPFQESEKLLKSSELLFIHFELEEELILSCDVSSSGIGAVLAHNIGDIGEQLVGSLQVTG